MNTEKSPLVNRLILLVLTLILGCLVLLVARSFYEGAQRKTTPVVTEVEAPVEDTLPASAAAPPPPAKPMPRAATTNLTRSVPAQNSVAPPSPVPLASATSESFPTVVVAPGVVAVPQPFLVSGHAAGPGASASGTLVFGVVTLTNAPPPETRIDLSSSCGRLHPAPLTTHHYVVGATGGLANVFVYIKEGAPKSAPATIGPVLDQVGCEYTPDVLGVMAGQKFTIRNSDPELHNIHSKPKPGSRNKEFNLGQPPGRSNQVFFVQPEVFVRLQCDIHPWMFAYIGVAEHPFFAVTDTNGFFAMPAGLPPGRYTLAAVHPKAGEVSQALTIDEGTSGVTAQFHFKSPRR